MVITYKAHNIFLKISHLTGYLFHPLLITLYVAIVALFGDTYLNSPDISLRFKLILLLYIALSTVVIPLIALYLLYFFKFITSFKNPTRSDRVFPLLIVAICYLACTFIYGDIVGQMFARKLFFTISLVVSVINILTLYYKVSLHAIGAATALALLIGFNHMGYGEMETEIIITIIISGFLATSILYLEKNTMTEIALSYAFGLFFTLFILWI